MATSHWPQSPWQQASPPLLTLFSWPIFPLSDLSAQLFDTFLKVTFKKIKSIIPQFVLLFQWWQKNKKDPPNKIFVTNKIKCNSDELLDLCREVKALESRTDLFSLSLLLTENPSTSLRHTFLLVKKTFVSVVSLGSRRRWCLGGDSNCSLSLHLFVLPLFSSCLFKTLSSQHSLLFHWSWTPYC